MRILVTGGAGYLGSHLSTLLSFRGHDVVIIDDLSTGSSEIGKNHKLVQADFADSKALNSIFADGPIAAVFHLAALTSVFDSMREPARYQDVNFVKSCKLLNWVQEKQIKRFIFSSSCSVYGEPQGEDGYLEESDELSPQSYYGLSKALFENRLRKQTDLHWIVLRFFNLYGVDPANPGYSAFQAQSERIIPKLIRSLHEHQPIFLFGNPVRDYLHVSDAAKACVLTLDKSLDQEILNVGSGAGYKLSELVSLIESLTQKTLRTQRSEAQAGSAHIAVAKLAKLKRLLDWTPEKIHIRKNIEELLAVSALLPRESPQATI